MKIRARQVPLNIVQQGLTPVAFAARYYMTSGDAGKFLKFLDGVPRLEQYRGSIRHSVTGPPVTVPSPTNSAIGRRWTISR